MITSADNQQLKSVRSLLERASARRKEKLFVAEGVRMFLESPPDLVHRIYASEDFMKKSAHADRIRALPHEIVSDPVFKKISDTHTPQGVLMVMKMPEYSEAFFEKKYGDGLFLIANRIQDPGNIGTMIRTAEAAGAAGVIMDKECADIFNPKVIRSTMGSVYRVPFIITDELPAFVDRMKAGGVKVVAGDLKGQLFYEAPDIPGGRAVIIGNEGSGISDELLEKADIKLKIPMEGKVSSLNAAVSAALFMYQMKRRI